jgi:hypothetical protein
MDYLPTFDEIFGRWGWSPIPNCPGRYTLAKGTRSLSIIEVVGHQTAVFEYAVSTARDRVFIVLLREGGVISYRRQDGSFLHTLGTAAAFDRKVLQLGIAMPVAQEPGFARHARHRRRPEHIEG